MVTYLAINYQKRKNRYWGLRKTVWEDGGVRTSMIHHIGKTAAVIDWLGGQQFWGRMSYSKAVEIANIVESSQKVNYIPLGPQWNDLEKLGYDVSEEIRQLRNFRKEAGKKK